MIDSTRAQAHMPDDCCYCGGCACGAVLWEVVLDPSRTPPGDGTVWHRRVPSEQFALLRGADTVSGVQFFAGGAHQFFCSVCGCHAFSRHGHGQREGASYAVDLRCVHEKSRVGYSALARAPDRSDQQEPSARLGESNSKTWRSTPPSTSVRSTVGAPRA